MQDFIPHAAFSSFATATSGSSIRRNVHLRLFIHACSFVPCFQCSATYLHAARAATAPSAAAVVS